MRTIALPNITLGQLKKDDTEIFNVQSHSAKQLRHFKYESVHLLISLFTSQTFLTQVIVGFFIILISFLAHLAKGNVRFCHHLASIVR
jgi:hypothetical protein